MFISRLHRMKPFFVMAVWITASWTTELSAQTELRWKLQEGDSLAYTIEQSTLTETAGTGKAIRVKLDAVMTIDWKVTDIDDKQVAAIAQTVRDFKMSLQADKQDPLVYDSKSKTVPAGAVREIAEAAKKVIGVPVQIRMTSRGEVVDVVLPDELKSAPPASSKAPTMAADDLVALFRQVSIVLPEMPVAEGAKWDLQHEVSSAVGAIHLDRQISYAGKEQIDSASRDKLIVQGKIQLKPESAPNVSVKEGTQNGTVWFDSEKGRLSSAEMLQKLVTERPYRETTIKVQSSSTLKLQLLNP